MTQFQVANRGAGEVGQVGQVDELGLPTVDEQDEVREKLLDTFSNESETIFRVLSYLDGQYGQERGVGDGHGGQVSIPEWWRRLHRSLNSERLFKLYATQIARITMTAAGNENLQSFVDQVYNAVDQVYNANKLPNSYAEGDRNTGQGFHTGVSPSNARGTGEQGVLHFLRVFALTAEENQGIISSWLKIFANRNWIIGLSFVFLSYEVKVNIHMWWKGEISGKRCCKNIVDFLVSAGVGVAGGVGGAAIGANFGPYGMLIGGVIGGVIACEVAARLSDRLTQWLFGIPKEEALENAYNYFGLKLTASNNDINAVFRQRCQEHSPENGGNKEEYDYVQLNMAVISVSKGQF